SFPSHIKDYLYSSFCKELKYNLFSVSQICDKKNNVLFTDTECLVLSSDFKLLDESQVLLRVPRKDNIYSVDLKSVVPTGGLTCLIAKATIDESNTWHRRLGHINFKTMNKLVKANLVKGLPSKIFENDHSCVAYENEASDTSGKDDEPTRSESERLNQREMQNENTNSINSVNTISIPVSTARPTVDTAVLSPPVNTARPSVNTANAFEERLFERLSPFKIAFPFHLS
ncbi:putative ribonuclease H-like domain-containing protein, partial [Tanacetum coccineum]